MKQKNTKSDVLLNNGAPVPLSLSQATQNKKATAKNKKNTQKNTKSATKSGKSANKSTKPTTKSGKTTKATATTKATKTKQKSTKAVTNQQAVTKAPTKQKAKGGAKNIKQTNSPRANSGTQAPVATTQQGKPKTMKNNFLRHNAPQGKLKVMFLGGVGEVGKNMTVFEYGDSMVILDAGMTFPGSDMPGVDVVIPDMTYVIENAHKLKGVLLTHGHEDHIGGLPFLISQLPGKVDIYGTAMTLALAQNKLIEHGNADKVNLVTISDRSVVSLDMFTVEFIHVSHSVAGSVAVCLRTPVGTVLHTGDFKIDYTPLGNQIMNLARFAEIGNQGVLLLMSESTNVEKPGYTMSESVVQDTLNNVFNDAKGRRLIIATFASNIDRVGMIIDLARQYNRKIAISGRSMIKYIETATRIGLLKIDQSMFVDIDKIGSVEDGKLVILSTGSQGEPMSALTRMASGEFNKVQIGSNDTIVISASPIPGNEHDVYSVINKLYRLGAIVVYSALSAVHVSGHACQEELKLIYTLVKPKYFIPVHGEYRHLKQHATLVTKLGHKPIDIIIPDIGDCVEMDKSVFKITGQVAGGSVMVDGLGVGDVGNVVLRDRLSLAEEGILVCSLAINKDTHTIYPDIQVISRGCFFAGDPTTEDPTQELKKLILEEIAQIPASNTNIPAIKTAIQRCVKRYFRQKLKRNPVVLPIIVEI